MSYNTAEIINRGMECLVDNLGVIDAEHFISAIQREKIDYTKWQRKHFDDVQPDEFLREAFEYDKTHPIK